MDTDEHPRPDTDMAGLGKLPPVFKKEGLVSAGNASVSRFTLGQYLRGYLTLNLKLACFVCYLKIISTLLKNYCMHLKANCLRISQMALKFSMPSNF